MNTIVFDIETGPLPEAELEALLPPFDPAEVKVGNLKDPEKIAAKIAEAEANHRQSFVDRAALDPLTGRVLAIGVLDVSGAPAEVKIIGWQDEAELLRDFWELCMGDMGRVNELIGFNSHLFDLPFLVRRSWKHRVQVPRGIRRGRYWSDQSVDLRESWQLGDRMARGSLDAIARHLGVGAKLSAPVAKCVPHGPMITGKDFAGLWVSDRSTAEAYLRNDLELTVKVAERLGCVPHLT